MIYGIARESLTNAMRLASPMANTLVRHGLRMILVVEMTASRSF